MRLWSLPLLLLMGVMGADGTAACNVECTTIQLISGPVCSSSGATFSSECHLIRAACTPELGSLFQKEYDGRCLGRSAHRPQRPHRPGGSGIEVSVGGIGIGLGPGGINIGPGNSNNDYSCRRPCYNQGYNNPICGSDGITYDNQCLFSKARCRNRYLTVKHQGSCYAIHPPPHPPHPPHPPVDRCQGYGHGHGSGHSCGQQYQPVCGSDGRTYNNDCLFNRAKCYDRYLAIRHYGQCQNDHHNPPHHDHCHEHCTGQYEPVCGSDGHTYNSYCHLKEAQCRNRYLTYRHSGQCGYHRSELEPQISQQLVRSSGLETSIQEEPTMNHLPLESVVVGGVVIPQHQQHQFIPLSFLGSSEESNEDTHPLVRAVFSDSSEEKR